MLVFALMVPSIVKLAHALGDHYHEVCTSQVNEHFHQSELDCEFQVFQVSNQVWIEPLELNLKTEEEDILKYGFQEITFINNRLSSCLLRGPPSGLGTTI